ncbi:MAG: response regulator [Treponema sp.]|nr:response regulator [Treponema sp.]
MERHKILIVDDSQMNRELLADMLEDNFDVFEAADGKEAYSAILAGKHDFSVMLLDYIMPNMNGFELLEIMNKKGWIQNIPVIMISSEKDETFVEKAYDLGVIDFIDRPFNERIIKRRIMSTISLSTRQKELSNFAISQFHEKAKDNTLMINILSHIVEFRNGESGLHVVHVSMITRMILDHLLKKTKKYGISEKDVSLICSASALHDIGKIAIPDEILNKPGRFTPEEFAIMKTHSMKGAEMLDELGIYKDEPLVKFAYQICRWHHERWDGKGYPDGIAGEEIPISAQVVALADVYDALTSKRCYKDALPHEKAVEMILNGECGAMNPELLSALSEISDELKNELLKSSLGIQQEIEVPEEFDEELDGHRFDRSRHLVDRLSQLQKKGELIETLTRHVMFELDTNPDVMNLSPLAAERLGISQTIIRCAPDEPESGLFAPGDFELLIERAKQTEPEKPFREDKYLMNIKGQERWMSITTRSVWTEGAQPEYQGAVGIIRAVSGLHAKAECEKVARGGVEPCAN